MLLLSKQAITAMTDPNKHKQFSQTEMNPLARVSNITSAIHWIRGEKVILDRDLAQLYQIETRALKQAVRRNIERFPEDFMFQLTKDEIETMVSQNVIPDKSSFGGALPMVFTEQGIAMLSSVLRSPQAVQVNIAIMRTFVQLRSMMDTNRDLASKIHALEERYDEQFALVFETIKGLIDAEEALLEKEKPRMGFHA